MREKYIDVDGFWGVILCYDYDRTDWARMRSIMESFGLDEYKTIEAIEVLRRRNTGMAISRNDITMSVMFISPATDREQFFDTLAHEIYHVQVAICEHYGVERDGEDAAWLQGYLMRESTRAIIPYMCD